ncbi:MAG: hypothetical protein Q9M32_05130 [Sulfurimonas sp.]|nr:hypothetical protein [Sulfurimonas sp.]
MKKLLCIIFPLSLLAISPFDTPKETRFNLSVFDTKARDANKKAMKNQKMKCRYVCDKKIYKEQKIADAISFYKTSSK